MLEAVLVLGARAVIDFEHLAMACARAPDQGQEGRNARLGASSHC
jgi:hypothetical protein